ncbi:MAG: hypothetical protein IAE90_07375 [Ignavibacteria bacterium]|nr:hypothetical protein [Ignavibacteria bacterium]
MSRDSIDFPAITKRVRHVKTLHNLSDYRIAKDCDYPYTSLRRNLAGDSNWDLNFLVKFAMKYEIAQDWLFYGAGDMNFQGSPEYLRIKVIELENKVDNLENNKYSLIPYLTVAQAGLAPVRWNDASLVKQHIPAMNAKSLNDPFVVSVEGDSMSNYLLNGDKILCADAPEKIKKKKLVMVAFKSVPDTTENSVKLITWSGNKDFDKLTIHDTITLYSINTKYEPSSYKLKDVHKVYKVIRLVERNIN